MLVQARVLLGRYLGSGDISTIGTLHELSSARMSSFKCLLWDSLHPPVKHQTISMWIRDLDATEALCG
jgi:hypothetical protein